MGEKNDILIIFFFCDERCFGYLVFVMPCRDGCIPKRYNIFMILWKYVFRFKKKRKYVSELVLLILIFRSFTKDSSQNFPTELVSKFENTLEQRKPGIMYPLTRKTVQIPSMAVQSCSQVWYRCFIVFICINRPTTMCSKSNP